MRGQEPLLGKTLAGRYKITGHIGEGAMASVFRASDLRSPGAADVAVKVMHPHLADDRTFAARFRQEARAASMVRHPNSVAILDVGSEDGLHFIAMELVGGRDLKDTLKKTGPLPQGRAVRIVAAICDALNAAHQLGVVHRDLKPENVMLETSPAGDRVKVLDFGIAKLVEKQASLRRDGDSEPPVTQFGTVVGTPAYMSPEQCRGQPLDGRSDLYTCGILLYQLVTGRVPFHSESPVEIAGKQAFEPPPPPSSHRPDLSPELEELILRALAKAPGDRPESALRMRDELLALLPRLEAAAPAAGSFVPTSKTVPIQALGGSLEELLRGGPGSPAVATEGPFAPLPGSAPSPIEAASPRAPLGTFVEPHVAPSAGLPPAHAEAQAPQAPAAGPAASPYPLGLGKLEDRPPPARSGGGGALTAVCVVLAVLAGVGVGVGLFQLVG